MEPTEILRVLGGPQPAEIGFVMRITQAPRHADYTDVAATEIDHGPHWSQRVAPRASLAALPKPPPLPRAQQVNAADRIVVPTPVAPPLPHAAAPVAFYSFAEEQAARTQSDSRLASSAHDPWALDTARVDPLPFGSIRPGWLDALDRMWSKYAAPALGVIAGLILVVGYLAYSTQAAPIASAASASRPVAPPVVMTAEIEAPAQDLPATVQELPAAVQAPTVTQVNVAPVAKPARVKKAKRGPVHINDATPLGDLRPSR